MTPRPGHSRFADGFTLIELLIAIAVFGSLSVMAVHSWRDEQLMATRQLGAACLLDAHHRLESLRAKSGRDLAAGIRLSAVGYASDHPICDDAGSYRMELSMGESGRYRLSAVARGRQIADGDLLLDVALDHPDPDLRVQQWHQHPDGSLSSSWRYRPASR